MNSSLSITSLPRSKVFAVFATILTAVGTAHIAWEKAPGHWSLRVLVVVLSIILLDGGFWYFESLILLVKSWSELAIVSAGMGLWWIGMGLTNIASAFEIGLDKAVFVGDVGMATLYLFAALGWLYLLIYQILRLMDNDNINRLQRSLETGKLEANDWRSNKHAYARADYIESQLHRYAEEHAGQVMPEWMQRMKFRQVLVPANDGNFDYSWRYSKDMDKGEPMPVTGDSGGSSEHVLAHSNGAGPKLDPT